MLFGVLSRCCSARRIRPECCLGCCPGAVQHAGSGQSAVWGAVQVLCGTQDPARVLFVRVLFGTQAVTYKQVVSGRQLQTET